MKAGMYGAQDKFNSDPGDKPWKPDFHRCVELKLTDTQKRKSNVYFNEIYKFLKNNLINVII